MFPKCSSLKASGQLLQNAPLSEIGFGRKTFVTVYCNSANTFLIPLSCFCSLPKSLPVLRQETFPPLLFSNYPDLISDSNAKKITLCGVLKSFFFPKFRTSKFDDLLGVEYSIIEVRILGYMFESTSQTAT